MELLTVCHHVEPWPSTNPNSFPTTERPSTPWNFNHPLLFLFFHSDFGCATMLPNICHPYILKLTVFRSKRNACIIIPFYLKKKTLVDFREEVYVFSPGHSSSIYLIYLKCNVVRFAWTYKLYRRNQIRFSIWYSYFHTFHCLLATFFPCHSKSLIQ